MQTYGHFYMGQKSWMCVIVHDTQLLVNQRHTCKAEDKAIELSVDRKTCNVVLCTPLQFLKFFFFLEFIMP